ncbi:MAG TPA: ABC transporter permease, partial [Longimicrobiales bacterium]|nr:ABC transporter permease [Longimicrobiales bacterium]
MTSERPDLREGRWVRRICGLYPTEFRALLEDDLVERYGEERRRVSRTRGRVVARWWATRTLGALLLGAALEWIRTGSRRLRRGKDGGRGTREIATMWETWTRDVRIAFRSLVRSSPGFTAVALATLALGASATTTVYSVVDGTLVRPLPWPESGELVQVWEISDRGARNAASSATFLDWREQSRSFEHLVARSNPAFGGPITVLGGVEPVRVTVSRVTEGFFPMMGVRPRIGRFLVEGDHAPSAPAVAVVDHTFWLRQLGGDPSIAERTVEIGGRPFQVVGVMPPSFDFPRGTRIWVPMTLEPGGSRTSHNWLVNGRLRDGVSPAEAAVEMRALTAALARRHAADMETRSARVVPLREALYGDLTLPLLLLLGGASCVLLVACSNLASTLLARGRTRAREIAVRTALGATRGRVVRLLLTESGLLAVGGALLGGLLARPMLAAALAAGPPLLRDRVALDPRALGVASTACAVTVLAFGLFPALAATRTDLTASLRD